MVDLTPYIKVTRIDPAMLLGAPRVGVIPGADGTTKAEVCETDAKMETDAKCECCGCRCLFCHRNGCTEPGRCCSVGCGKPGMAKPAPVVAQVFGTQ